MPEKKRAEKLIGSSLESNIKIKLKKDLYNVAKDFDFAELCITSAAEVTLENNLNDEIDVIRNKTSKAKGGRIGYKKGTGLMKKKSNVEKIKETFSPKNKIKFDAKKSDLDKSGDLSKYEKARGMAIAKAMAKRKNKKVI